ncbi:35209_t:CDS:2, partial [Gigaspora margarita]
MHQEKITLLIPALTVNPVRTIQQPLPARKIPVSTEVYSQTKALKAQKKDFANNGTMRKFSTDNAKLLPSKIVQLPVMHTSENTKSTKKLMTASTTP